MRPPPQERQGGPTELMQLPRNSCGGSGCCVLFSGAHISSHRQHVQSDPFATLFCCVATSTGDDIQYKT